MIDNTQQTFIDKLEAEKASIREAYLTRRWTMSPYIARIRLKNGRFTNDVGMIELCLEYLNVPTDNMNLNERIAYYDLFMELT